MGVIRGYGGPAAGPNLGDGRPTRGGGRRHRSSKSSAAAGRIGYWKIVESRRFAGGHVVGGKMPRTQRGQVWEVYGRVTRAPSRIARSITSDRPLGCVGYRTDRTSAAGRR
jgi:hypothetical protein